MSPKRFMNGVLRRHPHGREVAEILAAALAEVEPGAAVCRALRREGKTLWVNGQPHELPPDGRVFIVGGGKAGAPMTEAALEVLGTAVKGGLVIVKEGHLTRAGTRLGLVELAVAGHPVPDARGVAAAEKLAGLLTDLTARDLVVALISGGGSALLTWPAAGLSLADVQGVTSLLLSCGADIREINAVRKHCTRLSGGGLARWAAPARVVSLIISDVVDSPLDVIASGPTAPDETTYTDAWQVIEKYGLEAQIPFALKLHLRRGRAGRLPETVKPADEIWPRVTNCIVADNQRAANAACAAAQAQGFEALVLTTSLTGEARERGQFGAALARDLHNLGGKRALILGGETTVTLRGNGSGGRNQELALGAVEALAGVPGALLVTLATDGGDGPTDAAGAVVTGDTLAQARARGLHPHEFLARNDSYHFFAPLDALLQPGPTRTNVSDLLLLLSHA